MDCPVCLKQMEKSYFFNTEVDSCRFCGGVWLDGSELSNFIQKGKIPKKVLASYALDDSHQKVSEGQRECPRCHIRFQVVNHRGVNVDYCEDCRGFWFDRGELKKIMDTYIEEAKGKKKHKKAPRVVQEFDEDGDELIRIDDAGMFELSEEEEEEKQKIIEEMESNPLAKELLQSGSPEEIVKALPKSIKQKKDSFSLSPMGTPSSTTVSPLGTPMHFNNLSSHRYTGRHAAGNFIADCITDFIVSFFTARK